MKTHYLFDLPFATIEINGTETDAMMDTGFNGAIMLPKAIIQTLRLQKIGQAEYEMADGKTEQTDVYIAQIDWLGKTKQTTIISTDSEITLLGMELLKQAKTTLIPKQKILTIESI